MSGDNLERSARIVAMRLAGSTYPEIAAKLFIKSGMARYYCNEAVSRGEVTAEQIRHNPLKKKRSILSKTEYDKQWLARIFATTIRNDNNCWIWQGALTVNGYGQTNYRGDTRILHRKLYEVHTGVAPDRWQYVCHRCDERRCCNPDHLWLGTPKDNTTDMLRNGRHPEQRVTHCPKGHAYDAENTYFAPNGARACKRCQLARCRMRHGWPEALAYSIQKVPPGYSREVIANECA